MRRAFLVAPAALVAALIQAGTTAGAAEWCSDDPAVQFVDGAGNVRTVYLTTYGDGLEYQTNVNAQAYTYTVESDKAGHKTHVRLLVFVPDDGHRHFHVHSVVTTGANGTGRMLGHHDGNSGHADRVDFDVDD
jgi:hypothetical protein